jgi:hypothetical protein
MAAPAASSGVSAPDLSSSLISFQSLKSNSRQTLLDILNSAPCPQALIVDPVLTNPIGLICPVKEMRANKVQEILLLGSEERTKVYQSFHTTFILRPNPDLILQVKDIIFHHRKRISQQQNIHSSRDPTALSQQITFSIYLVPRRSMLIEQILHRYDLTNDSNITIGEYPLDLIPCDFDLLSLELPNTFTKIFIDGDTTSLFTIALSVIHLQVFFGIIPLIKGIGRASHKVAELIHRLSCELIVTSQVQKIDFGAISIEDRINSIESSSFSLFNDLIGGSTDLNKLNHSIVGVLSNGANPEHKLPGQNDNRQKLNEKVSEQQQKSSLSTQLSSLLSIGSTFTEQSDNNNNNNNNNNIGSGEDSGQPTRAKPVEVNPYDVSKPHLNSTYAQNPILNAYTLPQITQVMFIDRTVDLVSPMLIQRTYEGLLDESYGLQTQTIEYEVSPEDGKTPVVHSSNTILNTGTGKSGGVPLKKKKMSLNNSDVLFSEFRDVNIKVLGPLFTEKWSYIKKTYAQTDDIMSGTNLKVSDMESIVKKFKHAHFEHQLLPIHWAFAQKIKDFFASRYINQLKMIEEALLLENDINMVENWISTSIMKSLPLDKLLRVVILYAALYGTINRKRTEIWRKEMVHTYGLEILPLFANLQHLGIFFNTNPLSDDAALNNYMLQNCLSSITPRQQGQGQQPTQQQREALLNRFLEQNKGENNNELNLRIATSVNFTAPNTPIVRKPIWEKLSARLKLAQTEEHLIQVQQALFNKRNLINSSQNQQNNQQNNVIDNNEKKISTIQTLLREPIDCNFGYGNFYAPLSIRFVEMAAQPSGLKRLNDQLQIQSLLFSTPYSPPESTVSSLFSGTSASALTNQPLMTTAVHQTHLLPSAASKQTSPITPTTLGMANQGPQAISVSTGGVVEYSTNVAKSSVQAPAVFEYRQQIPTSLQQRMSVPDPHYFTYPLLSTTMVPQTTQEIQQGAQYEAQNAQFMAKKTFGPPNRGQSSVPPPQGKPGDQSNVDDLTNAGGAGGDLEEKKTINKPVCLVYFVGGVTHAELGMLRYLTESPTHKYAYIAATTKMVNSKSIINDLQRGIKEIGTIFD